MNSQHWLSYFRQNRIERPEPRWELPFVGDPAIADGLARSLSHFQLGESGEGTVLLSAARRACPGDLAYGEALALFVREEQEHARLLSGLVERFGGCLIARHWTHALFRLFRRSFGLRVELQILVIAELVGTAYYEVLRARFRDEVLEQVCCLILRDERAHVNFHAERFAAWQACWLPMERAAWGIQFQALFLAALVVVWCDHGNALRSLGGTRTEFLSAARCECIRFLTMIGSAPAPLQTVELAQ